MRNLKRALSMAMASVMLMGMSVVGTSAASVSDFSDVDSINNKEAVAIATGLGIFDGYDDGEFKPEKTVTRAEMAVIIAKILHGSDVDPSNFVGANKFTDVPAWAEGYVNLVASLGIIKGYGNGKFGPNDTVTTAQASTMLLKALGYYISEGDALGTDWDLQATSKATALGFYGDLSLKMNEGLTREDVAELTFNALFAQRVAFDDVRGLHVKANDRNVVVTNGTDDTANTLAQNTYGLYSAEGIVVANGMTDVALSASLKSEAQTTVMFTEETDLNQDGKFEYDVDDTYDFEVETGLDMIGHAAKVYYTIEKKAPVVFALVDQAELVATIDYAANTTNLAKRANDAGFKKNSILDVKVTDYIVNYDMDTKVQLNNGNPSNVTDLDKLILISNDASKEVNYVIALDQYLDVVDEYDEDSEDFKYTLDKSVDGSEMNIATTELSEDDFVVVTNIGNKGEIKVLDPAILTTGNLTKIMGTSGGNYTVTKITVDGENFEESSVVDSENVDKFTKFAAIETIGDVTLVMDQWGDVIGLAKEATPANYAYVAQFGIRDTTDDLNTKNAFTAHIYFADGTNGIYEIDTAKSNMIGDLNHDNNTNDYSADWTYFYTNSQYGNSDATTAKGKLNGTGNELLKAEAGAQDYKGLYNVKVLANGKVDIDSLGTAVTTAEANGVSLNKGLSTLVNAQGNFVTDGAQTPNTLLNNNDTVYFYVTGKYDDNLNVKVITGIKNVITLTNKFGANDKDDTIAGDPIIGTGIREVYATKMDKGGKVHANRSEIDVMLIQGIAVEGTDVYYYNKNYTVTKDEGGYVVTYKVWDNKTGDTHEVTYDNGGKYFATEQAAKEHADNQAKGFYTIGSKDLKMYYTTANAAPAKLDNIYYLVDDVAVYDDYNDNLMSNNNKVGSITENTKVVDTCNSGLDSIAKIAKAIENPNGGFNGTVWVSYSYDKYYDTAILFVTKYDPKGTVAPGGNHNTTYSMHNSVSTSVAGNGVVTMTGNIYANNDDTNIITSINAAAGTVKATYTVTVTTAYGVVKTYTYTDSSVAAINAGVFTGTIPGFKASANGSVIYDVDVTLSFQVNGKTVTVGGTGTIA